MSTTQPRFDLLDKLLARAFDPAAHEGEATNAASKAVTIARREGIGWADVRQHFGAITAPDAPPRSRAMPREAYHLVTFGKYAGRTLAEIARTDRPYLQWLAQTSLRNHETSDAAALLLVWLAEGGAL